MSLSCLDALNFKSNVADTESFKMRDSKPAKNLGELSRLPSECKEKFMELKKEQGVILHDSLEQKERYVRKLLASVVSWVKVFPQLDDVRDDNVAKRLKLFPKEIRFTAWKVLEENNFSVSHKVSPKSLSFFSTASVYWKKSTSTTFSCVLALFQEMLARPNGIYPQVFRSLAMSFQKRFATRFEKSH